MISPTLLDRYRKVCALLDSPEPGERATARRRKEKMEADYPGIHLEAYPPRPQEPYMSGKPFTVDDLWRTATTPEFANAVKAVAEAMTAQMSARATHTAPAEQEVVKLAARFDVDVGYDADDGEFVVSAVWTERTMDKILASVPVEHYVQLADIVASEFRSELVKALVAARGAFSG